MGTVYDRQGMDDFFNGQQEVQPHYTGEGCCQSITGGISTTKIWLWIAAPAASDCPGRSGRLRRNAIRRPSGEKTQASGRGGTSLVRSVSRVLVPLSRSTTKTLPSAT